MYAPKSTEPSSIQFLFLSPFLNMNQSFIEALEALNKSLDFQLEQQQRILAFYSGFQPRSSCCHSETTAFQLKDGCACSLELCELEK